MSFEDYDIVGMIGREAQGLLLGWREGPIGARGYYALQNLDLVSGESPDRLLREAALGAQVDHPALVRVHEVVVKDDWALVVTDYVDGHSLAEILDRRSAGRDVFPARVTLELVGHLLDAAQSIHDLPSADGEPCYHGRIGASKILLTVDGSLRLVGFGIASGEVERRSAERLGPAADQFAIGLVFLDLLVGAQVCRDESLQPSRGRWSRTLEDAIRSLPMAGPGLPVLLRMLAPQPEDRYASCAEAAVEVHRLRARFASGPALPGFAADEVAAVRADTWDETQPEGADQADLSEWLEDLPGEIQDEDFVRTVAETRLPTSQTLPLAPRYRARATAFAQPTRKTPNWVVADEADLLLDELERGEDERSLAPDFEPAQDLALSLPGARVLPQDAVPPPFPIAILQGASASGPRRDPRALLVSAVVFGLSVVALLAAAEIF